MFLKNIHRFFHIIPKLLCEINISVKSLVNPQMSSVVKPSAFFRIPRYQKNSPERLQNSEANLTFLKKLRISFEKFTELQRKLSPLSCKSHWTISQLDLSPSVLLLCACPIPLRRHLGPGAYVAHTRHPSQKTNLSCRVELGAYLWDILSMQEKGLF